MKTEKKNIFHKKILNKGRHHIKKLKIWTFSKRGGGGQVGPSWKATEVRIHMVKCLRYLE